MRTLTQPPAPPGRQDVRPRRSFLGWLAWATLRHRKWVIAAWAVAFIVGAAAASHVGAGSRSTSRFPGQPGYETATRSWHLPQRGRHRPPSLVVERPPGQSVGSGRAGIDGGLRRLACGQAQLRVVDYGVTGDRGFVTANGERDLRSAVPAAAEELWHRQPLRRTRLELWQAVPSRVPVSASPASTSSQRAASSSGPACFTETLVGAAGALAVLAFVFASFLAFVPLRGRGGLDPRHVPGHPRPDLHHRGLVHRRVPGGPGRPRGRHRLLAAPGHPLAGGAAPGAEQPRRPW